MTAEPGREGRGGWRAWAAGIVAFLVAFVANSHHGIHMLLISVGIGTSAILFDPTFRRWMLAASVLMTAAAVAWYVRHRRHHGPDRPQTLGFAASIALSVVLIALAVARDGW